MQSAGHRLPVAIGEIIVTTITGGATGATNILGSDELTDLAAAPLGAHSSTQFAISDTDYQVTGTGTGLSYSGGHLSGGTITSLTLSVFNFSSTWSGLSVSAATLWQAISSGDIATFDLLLFGGNDTFNSGLVGEGGDNFNGYAGDDTFNYTNDFRASDTINGGDGNDTLHLDGDYSGENPGLALFNDTLVNVENIVMAAGHTYQITTADGTVAAGATLHIDASALGAGNSLIVFGSAEKDGTFVLTGGAGDDRMQGGLGETRSTAVAATTRFRPARATIRSTAAPASTPSAIRSPARPLRWTSASRPPSPSAPTRATIRSTRSNTSSAARTTTR